MTQRKWFPRGEWHEMLRQERMLLKMTRTAFTERIDVDRKLYGQWELHGPKRWTALERVAAVLGKRLIFAVSTNALRGPWHENTPGKLLRACRKLAGWEQWELAERCGSVQPNISACESGGKMLCMECYDNAIRACRCHLRLRFGE